jgi:hypothetical protein
MVPQLHEEGAACKKKQNKTGYGSEAGLGRGMIRVLSEPVAGNAIKLEKELQYSTSMADLPSQSVIQFFFWS